MTDTNSMPPGSTQPRVAVITVSYGSEGVLTPFFETLREASNQDIITVLADNKAFVDSPVEEVVHLFGAKYLAMPSNAGYGGAINAAARTLPASVEWILICNPDVTFSKNALDLLVVAGDSDPLIGAVGPGILTALGEVYPSARSIPSLRNGIGHALLADIWKSNPWSAAYKNDAQMTSPRANVGWLSGACLLVRRSAFTAIGGFDEDFFMYFEDVDLGYRLSKLGLNNVYQPAALVTHSGAHSTATEATTMLTAHHKSAKRFLAKRYPGVVLWPVRTILSLGLDIRALVVNRVSRRERT
ncbi:glycosyltransferase family 2 protein [Cryobacterium sp. Hh11]|uniref:glycosyltransferase family 2 protein n=1 Tax=Cryobacterium sp. Hh11 TaxID=2555868 RepID=UPI00106BE3D1|nr:glycosyltransferase family 2 protein [Cryobacterium sp. Hh11]TFD53378.1 glycosyltransferase family 2 protein [Cryobacterium sp. Hh11]